MLFYMTNIVYSETPDKATLIGTGGWPVPTYQYPVAARTDQRAMASALRNRSKRAGSQEDGRVTDITIRESPLIPQIASI